MIKAYNEEKQPEMFAPRLYGLDLQHKHIPEIQYVTGLVRPPVFCPVVDDYYAGIATTIMLHKELLIGHPGAKDIQKLLSDYYEQRHLEGEHHITVAPELGSGMLESNWGEAGDAMMITVSGNDDLMIVTARFDNLGKGASGAAVQNMNIMLDLN